MSFTTTTAAIIASVAAIAGAGMSAVGTISSGMQQQKAAEAQARGQREAYSAQAEGARRNQQVAEGNAQATEAAAAYAEKQARLKAARLGGTQAMGYAKAGVLPEGSPLDIMAETAALEEQDILATRYNYQVQAARYRSQGDMYGFEEQRNNRLAGSVTTPDMMTGSLLKAGSSILTTGAGLAKTWGFGGKPDKITLNPNVPGSGGY